MSLEIPTPSMPGHAFLGGEPLIVHEGIMVYGRPGYWPVLAAYHVATGELIWQLNGSEGGGNVLHYRPLLAHDGKILIRVKEWTIHTEYYSILGYKNSTSVPYWPFTGGDTTIPSVLQTWPIHTTYHEVRDIATGTRTAKKSLDLGAIEYQLVIPTGTVEFPLSDAWYSAAEDYETYRSLCKTPLPVKRWEGTGSGWQGGDAYYTRGHGEGFFRTFPANYPDGIASPDNEADRRVFARQPMAVLDASFPIPPAHNPEVCMALPDGSGILFAPWDMPLYDSTSTLLVGGVPTAVGYSDVAPHGAYDTQQVVLRGWDLEQIESLPIEGDITTDTGQPLECGGQPVIPYSRVVGADLERVYARLDLSGDSPSLDFSKTTPFDFAVANTSGSHITTESRLISPGRVVNVSPYAPEP